MVLYINTKEQKLVIVALKKDGEVMDSLSAENEYGSQVLLPLIEKILKLHSTPGVSAGGKRDIHTGSVDWDVLEAIEVETGPGSFTGIRVGVSVANALGYSLGIPVNGKKIETEIQY